MIRRLYFPAAIAAGVVAADLVTKKFASQNFGDNPVSLIDGFLDFTYVENSGGAFGLFPNGGQIIAVAAIVVTGIVIGALLTARPRLEVIALGLILGGAVGNLVDRFARGDGLIDGPVIDWVNLWFIPTFNLADASVTVAVALLAIHSWRAR